MIKLLKDIWFLIRLQVHKLHFLFQKIKANKLHKITGKRYYVIPAGKNKLRVVDNSFIYTYNAKFRKIKGFKKLTIERLLEISFYFTSMKS